jgi:pantoate--beta-alanine ligase
LEVLHSIASLRKYLNAYRQSPKLTADKSGVGFVPTMGYLHPGHASLLKAARAQSGLVVLSIFVNPLQFGPNEDFDKYPRDAEGDLRLAEEAGVDVVFLPSVEEMYPLPMKTTVSVSGITSRLCGLSRPGHFDGVATVVSKLFHIVQPDQAFFGLKDAQQIAVIQQMVQDLNMAVEIVPCPTLREVDGLAMSSRNVYLNMEERKQALVLSESLRLAEAFVRERQSFSSDELVQAVIAHIRTASLADVDYVEVLTYPALESFVHISKVSGKIIIALAVRFGKTRLIDNLILPVGM